MTREIKFRVATKFCDDPFLGDVLELNLSEGTGTCYIWLHSYGGEEQDFDLNCGDKLMQYTGLTDKTVKRFMRVMSLSTKVFMEILVLRKLALKMACFALAISH